MAALNLLALETLCYDQLGLDSNSSSKVDSWINLIQQDLCARWPWNFLRSRENIVTVPDYTTGTVTIASGATSGTGTLTVFTTTQTGYFIQFAGANDWYKFTYVSPTSFTIDNPYQPTASATNVKYILRKVFYSLSSSCDRICDIKNWDTPLKLDELFPRDVDAINPNAQSTNSTYGFIPYGYDASNNVQIIPYPYPSDARLLEIKTFKRPTDMVASIDLPTVPNKWAHVVAFGANALGFAYLRKMDIASQWNAKFEAKIEDMKSQERISEDSSPVLRSIDSPLGRNENWLQMPDSYPSVPGRP